MSCGTDKLIIGRIWTSKLNFTFDVKVERVWGYRADKQVIGTQTGGRTDTQAMTIPEGQNWPRVINFDNVVLHFFRFPNGNGSK